jgi:GAF domain-containing protein
LVWVALAHEDPIDAEDRPVLEAVADLAAVAIELDR